MRSLLQKLSKRVVKALNSLTFIIAFIITAYVAFLIVINNVLGLEGVAITILATFLAVMYKYGR